jgi:FkbM family methyltransferase
MELARAQIEDLGAFKMVVSLDDDVSRDIYENRWYDEERWQTSVFMSHLQPGMSVLDLGGNIGFYTMMARSIIGPEGRVVTFEPYPRSAAMIRASIEANDYKNVTVVQAGVSDSDSTGKLYLSPDSWAEHSLLDLEHSKPSADGYTMDVELVTVDRALEKLNHNFHVDIIKIDIEGGEWRAVHGMTKVLACNPKLTIMTEFWPHGFSRAGSAPQQYLDFLQDAGFAIANMNAKTQKIEPMTVEQMVELTNSKAKLTWRDPIKGWCTNLLCTRS